MKSELLELLLLFLVIYFLVSFIIRYLRSQRDQEHENGDSDATGVETGQSRAGWNHDSDTNERQSKSGHSVVTCPHCGTENDPDFRYCSSCISELR